MKKYIFSESQVKRLVDEVVNEHIITEQRDKILKIRDLAEILSRLYPDDQKEMTEDIFHTVLIKAYRRGGDEYVMELFKDGSDLTLELMGRGRYRIK